MSDVANDMAMTVGVGYRANRVLGRRVSNVLKHERLLGGLSKRVRSRAN